MTAPRYCLWVLVCMVFSTVLEVNELAGLTRLSDGVYHGLHLFWMGSLVFASLCLANHLKPFDTQNSTFAFLNTCALAVCALGDYVNSRLSGISSVVTQLHWALLLFGTGYTLYVLWLRIACTQWNVYGRNTSYMYRGRYAIAAVFLVAGGVNWWLLVRPAVAHDAWLYYGSGVFNATIYTALPTLGLLFWALNQWRVDAALVCVGALLIPYSDLVLFSTWLPSGDVPTRSLYAINWLVYFAGQALFSLAPAVLANRVHRSHH